MVETKAPDGWATIDSIGAGSSSSAGTARSYRWNVSVDAGGTVQVPTTSIVNGTQTWPDRPTRSNGTPWRWANVKDNVPPVEKCGVTVAMLFDLSGSIGSNFPSVQSAATQFVDDLTGTPTKIALFTFARNSPVNDTTTGTCRRLSRWKPTRQP